MIHGINHRLVRQQTAGLLDDNLIRHTKAGNQAQYRAKQVLEKHDCPAVGDGFVLAYFLFGCDLVHRLVVSSISSNFPAYISQGRISYPLPGGQGVSREWVDAKMYGTPFSSLG